jgi:hypothetical protein
VEKKHGITKQFPNSQALLAVPNAGIHGTGDRIIFTAVVVYSSLESNCFDVAHVHFLSGKGSQDTISPDTQL